MKITIIVGLLCIIGSFQNIYAQNISVMSEKSVLVYEENGKVMGPVAEVVKELLKASGFKYEYGIYPWPRAYKTVQERPNHLLTLIARTPEREKLFKWVDVLLPVQYYLIKQKKRSDIMVKSLNDAKKLLIGVVRDDVRHKYFLKNGFTQLEIANDNKANQKKLLAGRIDAYPLSNVAFYKNCQDDKNYCQKLERGYLLDELSLGLYIAYGLNTDDKVVEATRNGLETIKKNGVYDKIFGELSTLD